MQLRPMYNTLHCCGMQLVLNVVWHNFCSLRKQVQCHSCTVSLTCYA